MAATWQVKYTGSFSIRHMNWFLKYQQWLFSKMQLSILYIWSTSAWLEVGLFKLTGELVLSVLNLCWPQGASLPMFSSLPSTKKEIQRPKEFLSLIWQIEPHSEYQKSLVQNSKLYTTEHKNPAEPALWTGRVYRELNHLIPQLVHT